MMVPFPHKILIPRRPSYLVQRPRLFDLLQGIDERRLVTLSAPAGYGKTSLLTDFAALAPLPICWYTLDRFDEDPWVFLSYVVATVDQRFPGAMAQTMALLAGPQRNAFATAAQTLVRELYAVPARFILLFDDWHLVDHVPEITELMADILLQCVNCHLIIASRIYPSLPDIMLLAARRQMSGLDEEHLRFTAPEIAAVLGAEYHTVVPLDEAQTMAEQSNGWITGVLLAYQVTGASEDTSGVSDVRAERQVYRFLVEQVFDRQPESIRAFLLQSSLLEDLTAERCDTMLGRSDAGRLLQTLLRLHLFISEIEPGVLRYHPLFREFLQEHFRTIEPQLYYETALRVASGYMALGQWSQAFDTCVAAGDYQAARSVVMKGGEALHTSGRLETLERWFGVLPLEELDAPLLCLKARVLMDRGQTHEAQALAELALARMQPHEEAVVLLLQAQLARINGRYEEALEIAAKAEECSVDPAQRAMALRTQGMCHHRLGAPAQAIERFDAALALERRRGDPYLLALLQQDLGVCYEEVGQLQQAAEFYTQADTYWAMIGSHELRAVSLNCKGVVQHLMGHYQAAFETLTAAVKCAQDAQVPGYEATAHTSLGDLFSDLQLWARAAGAYTLAQDSGGNAFLQSYIQLAQIRLQVRQRQYDAAAADLERISHTTRQRLENTVRLLDATIACGLGQRFIAGRKIEQVIASLDRKEKPMDLARAYLLQAHIVASPPNVDVMAMLAALERAANIADELGNDAFLVNDSLPFVTTLRRAQASGWVRASDWLRRHQGISFAAQSLRYDTSRPLLVIRTLGTDQIMLNGEMIEMGWLKAREVFYYLLAHPNGITTDGLRDAIWPDLSRENSRNALKTAIYQLRSLLPRDLIELQGRQMYVLNRESVDLDYDVERLMRLLPNSGGSIDILLEALELYSGPYLPWSEHLWAQALRDDLEQRFLQSLRLTAGRCEQDANYLDALTFYRRLLAIDILDEAAHAGVMRCQLALGNRAAAIGQYQALRRLLGEELGLELGSASEVDRLYHSILIAS